MTPDLPCHTVDDGDEQVLWSLEVDGVIEPITIASGRAGEYLEDYLTDNQERLGITVYLYEDVLEIHSISPFPISHRVRLIPDRPYDTSQVTLENNPTVMLHPDGSITFCLLATGV